MVNFYFSPCCAIYIVVHVLLFFQEVSGECDVRITYHLKRKIVPGAIKFFQGNFTDVWASKHVIEMLNSSYTEIWDDGNITNYVINKDGRGFSASGKIWSDIEGVIHIKVEGFDKIGMIFPVFATPKAIAYYSCYPDVEGPGVSVIAARRNTLLLPDTMEHVLEAKVAFRRLHEQGIPINDGIDYDHG